MVKKLNIYVKYNEKARVFVCSREEFLNEVAKFYRIDVSEIELYDTDMKRISLFEIQDFMKIEVVTKSRKSNGDTQRSMRSYITPGESSKKLTIVEGIISKLKTNSVLSGMERSYLVDHLQDYARNPVSKRNHNNESNYPVPKRIHKKVQANPSKDFKKDSFTQTDLVSQAQESCSQETEDAVTKLQKIAASADDDGLNLEEVKRLMKICHRDRRDYILRKLPPVAAVKEIYPLLFSLQEVKNELDRLFYPGKSEEFISNIDKYARIILNVCDPEHEIIKRTQRRVEKSITSKQKKYAEAVGSILALPSLMEQKLGFINLSDNPCTPDNYPYIDAPLYNLRNIFFDEVLFKIITENHLLCEATDFREAILCLMASYFIFHISYPEECNRTLIIFEKLFLCANDTEEFDDHTQQMIKFLKLKAKSQ